jgi:Cu(I)/Ag(I) efflux system membrane fusion protein
MSNTTPRGSQIRTTLLTILAVLSAGGLGYYAGVRTQPSQQADAEPGAQSADARRVLYWYDPMYPQQRFEKPGKSPFMDMALVPRYAESTTDRTDTNAAVRIDPQMAQQLGMREAEVRMAVLPNLVAATGTVALDPRGVVELQARATGFVEHATALAVGDIVSASQPLFALRVPAWRAAADEWLLLTRTGDDALATIATQRLQMLGMTERDIATLKRTRRAESTYTIASPIDGVVVALPTRPGMTVAEGQALVGLNSIRRVVLEVAVPEAQSSGLRVGDIARARMTADPSRMVTGGVDAILPTLDPGTRTVQLRVWLANAERTLRPGATARVEIESSRSTPAASVPTEAVIRVGRRTIVMLSEGAGRYRPVEIETGAESGGLTEVVRGLQPGQRVVASGQFLLDSESSLLGVRPSPLAVPGTLPAAKSQARPEAPADARPSAPAAAREATVHEADARVVAIAPGRVTLAHGPFASLQMPAMTMTFPVDESASLEGVSVGARVRVGVRETATGLEIVRVAPAGATP